MGDKPLKIDCEECDKNVVCDSYSEAIRLGWDFSTVKGVTVAHCPSCSRLMRLDQ